MRVVVRRDRAKDNGNVYVRFVVVLGKPQNKHALANAGDLNRMILGKKVGY